MRDDGVRPQVRARVFRALAIAAGAVLCSASLGIAPRPAYSEGPQTSRGRGGAILHERLGDLPDEVLALASGNSGSTMPGSGRGAPGEPSRRERQRDTRSQ